MNDKTIPITGGCLCGAIRYEVSEQPAKVAHCHCERCRRSTGAAFATGVGYSNEIIKWQSLEPSAYQSSEHFDRLFCPQCGSSLAQHNHGTGMMWLLAGTLDYPESITPESHIFSESEISWAKIDDGLPRLSTKS